MSSRTAKAAPPSMKARSIAMRRRFPNAGIVFSLLLILLAACSETALSESDIAASQSALAPLLGAASPASPVAAAPAAPAPAALPALAGKTVWVRMTQKASLAQAVTTRDWKTRGQLVYTGLTTTAASSQAGVRALLASRGAVYKSFWIVNALRVTADQATIDELARRPDVAEIVPDKLYSIPPVQKGAQPPRIQDIEWNIQNIRAPDAWATFGAEGDGIVVASIDTGVQFDHPALVRQYRGNIGGGAFDHNYNWFDPTNVCGFPSSPCDNVFHGTHTMGTMVGDDQAGNQIGVAPHARWIAAKGCEPFGCTTEALLSSGQWILAPTDLNGQNPRPDLRPNVVNNSWGNDNGLDTFFQETVQAWVSAGIFPAFANGNAGQFGCGTVGAPGSYPESYGVGAYDIDNSIALFSSRGASPLDGSIKPNISAPGVNVRSSVPGNGYDIFSGTSMATPHLAAAVALIWSVAPALIGDIAATRAILDQTAVDTPDLTCGGTPENNNVFGQGRLDAFEAVNASPRGPSGTLHGLVSAATGEPIPGAAIHALGPSDRRTVTSATGEYTLRLGEGAYSVTASAFGYLTQTATDVSIVVDTTTEQNFSLAPAPSFPVTGVVRDGNGAPIAGAQVTIVGTPIAPAFTDTNGLYSFASVPAGDYQVTAQAGGCFQSLTSPLTVDGNETLDFVLLQRVDAFGYSCRSAPFGYVEANTVLPLIGDDASVPVSLPFTFPFYGFGYTTVNVQTNGYLEFQTSFPNFVNVAIPTPQPPNAAIYPFWDDLLVDDQSSVRTETIGTAPSRQFIIEWRDVAFLARPDLRLRFEVVLFETGQILLQYDTADPDPLQQGSSATVGIENELGTVALQYSFNQAALHSGLALRYSVPPSGAVRGTVSNANDGTPIVGARVAALQNGAPVRTVATDAQGLYQLLQLPVGDYTIEASAANYGTQSAAVHIAENATVQQNFALKTARATLSPAALQLTVPPNQTRTRTLTLANTGSAPLEFVVHEAGGGRQATAAASIAARAKATSIANPNARSTREMFNLPGLPVLSVSPLAAGDVIRSFPPTGMQLAWGVGYTGNVWLSDAVGLVNTEFTTAGAATGRTWPTRWVDTFPGDLAYDPNRGTLCQVNVGGDNGIYCWDPNSGNVVSSITGSFPWTAISQRGLAYKAEDDTFYIGGWNDFTVYHIQGLSSATPGSVISSCQPADGFISGLAYNPVGVLWATTNTPTDTIYELNPDDCTVLSTLPHPQPGGFQGGGLDMDDAGNLWTIAQTPNQVFLLDSGVPAFTDVPWLSVTPESGTVATGRSQALRVTVDTHGLTPGLYLATLFIQTSAARETQFRVPVSLLVPDYQQAVNAGGRTYTDTNGDSWAADRQYTTGQWGYVQKSKTLTTTHSIAGTVDPRLYQSQRVDPYAYRFDNVPNGVYQIELLFAELENVRLGDRLFDVIVEDTVVLPAHDIAYEVGRYTAEARTFFVDVSDGQVDIRFIPRAGFDLPVINALRITHRNDR